MQFFTRDLFLRFNSLDMAVAVPAHDEWDKVTEEYRRHVDALAARVPSAVSDLARRCFQDAELSQYTEAFESTRDVAGRPALRRGTLFLTLQSERAVTSIVYTLSEPVVTDSGTLWPFSKDRKHWMYDEMDEVAEGAFRQRILWSDGSVIEIPFTSVAIHVVDRPALPAARRGKTPRVA